MAHLPRGLALGALLAVACLAVPAFAAPQLSIVASGAGGYLLQGSNFADVCGLDATITYDQATLANPVVKEGPLIAGSMMVSNTKNPGTIQIALIRLSPINGSGTVATLTFAQKGASGRILSLVPKIINCSGGALEAAQPNLPEEQKVATADEKKGAGDTTQPPPSGATITPVKPTATVTGGTVTLPSDSSSTAEKVAQESRPASSEPPPPAAETTPPATPSDTAPETAPEEPRKEPVETAGSKETVYPSLLERFRDFAEERNAKSLEALFADYAIPGVKQEPAILLSDGKNQLTVRVDLPASEKDAPNFALRNAKLISLKMSEGGSWVIEAQPKEKSFEVTLSVLQGARLTEIPLVVAPVAMVDLDKSGKLDEKDVQLFLRETGTPKEPKFDLNADGKRDYIDEYIFFANYLAAQKKAKEKAKPAEKGPAKPGEKAKGDAKTEAPAKPEGAVTPAPGAPTGSPKP